MLTFGDNRFVVASWGRAGSSLLCELLYCSIESPTWIPLHRGKFDDSFNIKQNVVGHCHSLDHLKQCSEQSIIFLAIRTPSLAAISRVFGVMSKYMNVRSENYVSKLLKRDNWSRHQKEVVEDYNSFVNQKQLYIDIDELNKNRIDCIEWNKQAIQILNNRDYYLLNYDIDGSNIPGYVAECGFDCNTDDITLIKNPKRWEDYTTNTNEILEWLDSNKHEDVKLMEEWSCRTTLTRRI